MGYPMPSIPYASGFASLGQSVAKTGGAIKDSMNDSIKIKMLNQRFANIAKAKDELKAEVAQTAAKHWTPNQITQFSKKIDAIDNVDALIEIGAQFGQAWTYYDQNKDSVKAVPMPFQKADAYIKFVEPQIKESKRLGKQKSISSAVSGVMNPQLPQESEAGLRDLEDVVGGLPGGLPQNYQPEPQAAAAPGSESEYYSQLQGKLPEDVTTSDLKANVEHTAATKGFADQPKPMTRYQQESLDLQKQRIGQQETSIALRRQEIKNRYKKNRAEDEANLLKDQRQWISMKDTNRSKQAAVSKAISAADKNNGVITAEIAEELFGVTGDQVSAKDDLVKIYNDLVDNGVEIEKTIDELKMMQKAMRKNKGADRATVGSQIQAKHDDQVKELVDIMNSQAGSGSGTPIQLSPTGSAQSMQRSLETKQIETKAAEVAKSYAEKEGINERVVKEAMEIWKTGGGSGGQPQRQVGGFKAGGTTAIRGGADKYQKAAIGWWKKNGKLNPTPEEIKAVAYNKAFRTQFDSMNK